MSERPTQPVEPDPDRDDADETSDETIGGETKVDEAPPTEAYHAEPDIALDAGAADEPSPGPAQPAPRRLHRSREDRVVAGVCGGLASYFGIDAVLMRIAFVLLVFAGGLGILAYVLGWIFIPEEPAGAIHVAAERDPAAVEAERRTGAFVLGLIFVALGVLYLFDVAWPNFLSWRYVWPIALIAIGVAVLMRARR